MKTKWIFGIVAVMIILWIFTISQGADRFYYGAYNWVDSTKDFQYIGDSLRCNILWGKCTESTVDSFANHSLRAMVQNLWGEHTNSPSMWAWKSHYTMWEAEGLDESWVNLEHAGWGEEVNDPSASGGKAMKFSGPGTPDTIQRGPTYYQEPKLSGDTLLIGYTAEFRLKFHYSLFMPLGALGGNPPDTSDSVCRIMVVDRGNVLKDRKIYKSEFPGDHGGYETFELEYTIPGWNQIQFQIVWFALSGAENFYIDYVKVYDVNGRRLMGGEIDEDILDYVSQDWVETTIPETGDTVVYRWYLRDEPPSIDLFATNNYIDTLLRRVSTERVGMQVFGKSQAATMVHEYFLRQDPKEYHIDLYPVAYWWPHYSGHGFQQGVDNLTKCLNRSKDDAENQQNDFWVTIQTFVSGWELLPGDPVDTCCAGCTLHYNHVDSAGSLWCCDLFKRFPTPYEVRLQTFLASCYGADGIINWSYYSRNGLKDSIRHEILLGLYDHLADTPTDMWREIKDFTGPRMEKLGPVLNDLAWQGACSDDSVGSFTLRNEEHEPSYIHNIVPCGHYPAFVEVGFFKDESYDQDYFMLVNRRCLSDEGDSFTVFLEEKPGSCYVVEDMYDSSMIFLPRCPCGYDYQFTVCLEPGEGRLFKLWENAYTDPAVINVPSEQCSTIQAGIDSASSGQIVLVDTGTYYENIDFRGNNILVTSKFHTTGDTSYISRTIIDGSQPQEAESASVVRFVSGENCCAWLKGFTLRNGSGTLYSYKGTPALNGGGVFCKDSSPTIANNIIVSNVVTGAGGGVFCIGNSSPRIVNNIIRENTAESGGGVCGGDSQMITAGNLILQNTAYDYGGGIDLAAGVITNNTIVGDSALHGGGIYVSNTTCQIVNNIVVSCKGGRGIWCGSSPQTISYNNVWDNVGGDFCSGWGDMTDTNRNETPCDSFYNISQNPNFGDDYHLDSSSPCVDAGDNNAPALPPTDFDGYTRVMDDPENDTFFVDMGAYEHQPEAPGGPAKIAAGDTEDTESKSSSSVPENFSLMQNYPNPFNPTTALQYDVAQPVRVSLKVYNILGQQVKALVDEEKAPGSYTVHWDGNHKDGRPVSSGIYFYRLEAGDFTEVKKMVLLK